MPLPPYLRPLGAPATAGRPQLDAEEGDACEQITGQGEDEVRRYVFGLRVPRRGHPDHEQLTLYFFDPVMPGHEGWPLWLKLLDAGALVEVEVGLVDIPDLVDEGGALRDPGRDILATSIKVFVPERNG